MVNAKLLKASYIDASVSAISHWFRSYAH